MQPVPDAEFEKPPARSRDNIHDLRRSVGADMEAIFALLPRLGQPSAAPSSARGRVPAKRAGAYWLVALLVGALVLAAAAAFLPQFWRAPKDKAHPAPAPIAMMAIPIETNAATPPPPPRAAPAKPPPERPVARPKKPAPRERTASSRPATPASAHCRRGDTAWCMHDRALVADGALRDAYADAVRAGVKRSALVDIRDDWQRLRRRAGRDPAATIDGYTDLTGSLRRLTRERTGR